MDAHGITREHVMLTPDMVRKLNEDEHTQVLEYEYDTPEKLLSMQDVARVLEEVRRAHAALRAQEPGLTDAELRTRLVDGCADVAVFSRTHPTIFAKVTDRTTPAVMLERLQQMMRIRAQQERGHINETETAAAVDAVLRQKLQ